MNMGRLILEADESWGDEPSSAGEVAAPAEISKTPPGLMSELASRAGPSRVVSEVVEKGPAVPSWYDIA